MRYCQGNKCHEYRTKDRIRGTKGNKSYQTRRRASFYYGKGNFCSMNCMNDWFVTHGEQAINHFGRVTEPKKVMCDQAWYKIYDWKSNGRSRHYFVNDLLGQRIAITEAQYNDEQLNNPNQIQK